MPDTVMMIVAIVVTAVIVGAVTAVIAGKAALNKKAKSDEEKINGAETKAREIIDEALRVAETKKREALLEAKEEALKNKNEFEKETKERRAELQKFERRVLQKEENLDKKLDAIEKREAGFAVKEEEIKKQKAEIAELHQKRVQELERISGLTSEQAKDYLLKIVEEDVKHDTAKMIKELEAAAKDEASKKARDYVVTAIQKCAADHVAETTISVVQLPNDEMKGRIIGREGRNVRTIESVTGVDLIIDDTPEAIVISSFDPLRREIARLTLETLIKDGRIHPGRIEEVYDKMCNEINQKIKENGKNVAYELGISKIDPELLEIIGKLQFRTSYGQNALKHSKEVAYISGLIASELGENVNLAKRAGLLHDIGKAIDFEMEGSHVDIGMDIAKKYNENKVVINAIASHHGDVAPDNIISVIVSIADTISASRPGARNDSSENYFQRLEQLEKIGNESKGVEKTYAIQAGRELRVIVKPEEVDDLTSYQIAREIKEKIESQMQYPGTIKVTVIRETRATEEAK